MVSDQLGIKILFSFMLFVTSLTSYSVSITNCITTFKKLQLITHYNIKLIISSKNETNAYSFPGYIVITKKMIKFCDTEADIASVLGHEFGHSFYKDFYHKFNKKLELRADKFGFSLCKKLSNTDCFHILYKFKNVSNNNGNYPSWDLRIKNLQKN